MSTTHINITHMQSALVHWYAVHYRHLTGTLTPLLYTDHGDAKTNIILPLSLLKAFKHHVSISITVVCLIANKNGGIIP